MCGGGADMGPKISPNGDSQDSGYQGMVRKDRVINALPGIKSMQAAPEYSYQGNVYDQGTNSFQQQFSAPTEKASRTTWLTNKDSAGLKIGDSFNEANAFGANGKITGITANNMVGTNSFDEINKIVKEDSPDWYALNQRNMANPGGTPGNYFRNQLYEKAYSTPGQLITYEFDAENRSKVANSVYNAFNQQYSEAATGNPLGARFDTNDLFNSTNDAARFINGGSSAPKAATAAAPAPANVVGSSQGYNYAAPKTKVSKRAPTVLNSSPTGGSSGASTTGG
jgi:hypothetical protein